VDATILDILACPDTHHAPLRYGIPVLLLDEARPGSGPGTPTADDAAEATE
jgi:uncharacterized protein YbaR (Trm112 family)